MLRKILQGHGGELAASVLYRASRGGEWLVHRDEAMKRSPLPGILANQRATILTPRLSRLKLLLSILCTG